MRYLFLLLLCLQMLQASAQSAKKFLKKADEHFKYKEYDNALEEYLEALKLDNNLAQEDNFNFQLGFCYLNSTHRDKSLPYFEKVFRKNPTYDKELEFFLAQAYHYNSRFDDAILHYEACKPTFKSNENQKMLLKKIQECTFGKEYAKFPTRALISNIGNVINSKYPDYAPVITADEKILVFTSKRNTSTGGQTDPEDGQFFEDIYITEKTEDTITKNYTWSAPRSIGRNINSATHDACIALSYDGTQLFVYKTGKGGMGDIYVSKREGAEFSSPKSLGDNINTKYREPSVSITPDAKTIYFSSDRPGGFGGLDIYKSTLDEKGNWGVAVNLGAEINTEYDEDSPFIHDNETLYFSSKGHSSMGDYDIFVAQTITNENDKTTTKWAKPVNLGMPVNTADDDIYFILSADNRTGYYSSGKEGGFGEKDIYTVRMPELKLRKIQMPPIKVNGNIVVEKKEIVKKRGITILKGTITDKKTNEKLISDIVLVDLAENRIEEEFISENPLGKYETVMKSGKNYLITVTKEGYLFHSEDFNIPFSEENQTIILDVALDRLAIGNSINLKVFYDFDKDFLRPESKTELERLYSFMKLHQKIKVEIGGHTDAIGTDEKNLDLSNRRASSVVKYLEEKGIEKDRLVAKGYGKTKPIATNDTDKTRQLNRRTECKIISL